MTSCRALFAVVHSAKGLPLAAQGLDFGPWFIPQVLPCLLFPAFAITKTSIVRRGVYTGIRLRQNANTLPVTGGSDKLRFSKISRARGSLSGAGSEIAVVLKAQPASTGNVS